MALPVFRTSFVGRESESAAVHAAARPGAVVNIIGPGGVGKTRLASRVVAEYAGPAAFVDLSAARTDDQLVDAVIASLGIAGDAMTPDRRPADVVGTWLARRRRLLLVLDNFEQLPESASHIVEDWRSTARDPVFVVTSRRPLDVRGEACVRLDPMPGDDGVQLFLERVPPRAPPIGAQAARVREVVERLDGLPLAIELAAARLDILTLEALVDALADRFELLSASGTAAGGRQGSLWRLVEWSWDLLEPWQRTALLRLSLFCGGAPLDGARQVIGPAARGEPNALDALQSLVRASLLRVDAPVAGVPRYTMLESIRAFLAEQWPSEAVRLEAQDAHAAFYLAQGPAWSRRWYEGDEVVRERMIAERDNFDAVRERGLARDSASGAETAVRALSAIRNVEWRSWRHSQVADANAVLEAAERHGLEPSGPLVYVYAHRAYTLRRAGRPEEALADSRRAQALADRLDDRAIEAAMAGYTGNLLMLLGREDEARVVYEDTLVKATALGRDRLRGMALHALANQDMRRGDFALAEQRLRQATESLGDSSDQLLMARPMGRLGCLRFYAGDLEGSLELLRAALALEEGGSSSRWVGMRTALIGRSLHAAGRMDEARAAYDGVMQHLDDESVEAGVWMAMFELDGGDPGRGRAMLQAALSRLSSDAPTERELVVVARIGLGLHALGAGAASDALGHAAALRGVAPGLAERDRPLAAMSEVIEALTRAVRAADTGQIGPSRQAIAEARRLAEPLSGAPNGTLRIVERLLATATSTAERRSRQLTIARDGSWFAAPEHEAVRLHRRRTLTRVLRTLVAARESQPGVALPLLDLFAGGWPNQHVAEDVAANRVYNAVSTLRGLGLDLIERRTEGYLLPAEAPMRLSDAAEPE